MPIYIALLRAVNVGGTGKLPMADLKAMCEAEGFERVQTYIASGNVMFEAAGTEQEVQVALAQRLNLYAGKPVGYCCAGPRSWRKCWQPILFLNLQAIKPWRYFWMLRRPQIH